MVVGGIAQSLVNFRGPLLRELVARGFSVTACAPDAPDGVRAFLASIGVEYVDVPIARAGMNPIGDWATLQSLKRVINTRKPDVVLAYTAKPVIYSSLAARGAGSTRVYAMITGLGYAFGDGSWRQRLVGAGVQSLYRRALKRSAGVMFQNPDDRDLFRARGLLPAQVPVRVINGSGVDLAHFAPQPLPARPVFLLMARLLADKGVREYHAAAQRVKLRYPDARFQLAGNIDPNPSSISAAELQAWAQEGAIEYLGKLEDVRPALAAARVYVLPSYREGTPRTVLEAMATGRPIITTDAPGCRETVVDGVNGFRVPPKDAGALAAAMIRMIEAPEIEIQRMADASLAMARDRYDVHKVNADILDFMGLG
jgi:glycosyltransferase involved in cell wall biosynthesis